MQELGIPTANVCSDAVGLVLSEAVTGIYYGWASIGSKEAVHMMVMSVGFNPFFGNTTKTCEPWILETFPEVRLLAACGGRCGNTLCEPDAWAGVTQWQ